MCVCVYVCANSNIHPLMQNNTAGPMYIEIGQLTDI